MKRIFYRIAHKDTKQGLWYNKEGRYTGARQTGKFSFCKNSYLPMPFDLDLVGYLSVTDSLTSLFEWFSKKEIELLELYGFRIAIYETECYKEYKNHWAIKESCSKLVKMIRVCELVEIPTPKNLLGVKGSKVAVDFDDYEKVSCLSWEVQDENTRRN